MPYRTALPLLVSAAVTALLGSGAARPVHTAIAQPLPRTPAGYSHVTAPVRPASTTGTTSTASPVSWSLTSADQTSLAAAQPSTAFGPVLPTYYDWSTIAVNDATRYQGVRGMGAALTESSAWLIDQLPATTRAQLLDQLFNPVTGAGISVLRIPLGASDFALSDYTYDDMPWGQSDPTLAHFSIARDTAHIVPIIVAARKINPKLTVIATPWSAPAWMKTNVNTHSGQLAPADEDVYARYLTRAVLAMRAAGVPLAALTVTNEPEASPGYSPSMAMSETQQARLVGVNLRPQLNAAGLADVQIIGYDHNWDDTSYPTAEVTGPYASSFAGTAFHCYAGDVSAQSAVAAAAPGKQIWTTECSGGAWSPDFAQNLRWNAHSMVVGAFRNSATASLWFNLALNPTGGPTNGGCTDCRGVITIDPSTGTFSRNVEYWLLAEYGRVVQPGAVRVDSTASNPTGVQSVAFVNPDGSHGLILYNEGGSSQPVTVRWNGRAAQVHVPSGGVAALHW